MKTPVIILREALQHALDELHRVNASHACVRPDVTYAAMEALRQTFLAPIEQIIQTRNKPRRNMASDGLLSSPNTVRVYRNSPEDVTLQLRRTKDYIGIALTFDEAKQIAAMLVAAANELEG